MGTLADDSKPRFAYALSNQKQHKFVAASETALAPGNHVVRVKFQYAGGGLGKGGTAILLADEKEVAKVDVPETLSEEDQQKLREAIGKVMMGGH